MANRPGGRARRSRRALARAIVPSIFVVVLVACLVPTEARSSGPTLVVSPFVPPVTAISSSGNVSVNLWLTGLDPESATFESNVTGDPCGSAWWILSYRYNSSPAFSEFNQTVQNLTEVNWTTGSNLPGTSSWWMVTLEDPCNQASFSSSPLLVTQPRIAVLNWSLPTPTLVVLAWNNPARYGGLLSFESYEVTESVQGGPWTGIANLSDVSDLGYSLSDLTPSTIYQFQVVTWDNRCDTCTQGNFNMALDSSAIAFTTAPALDARATASHTSVDVGQPIAFSCFASGGSFAYSYSWNFGDGTTATGSNVTHTYTTTGAPTATCTVNDSESQTNSSSIPMTVDPALAVSLASNDNRTPPGFSLAFRSAATGGSGTYDEYSWSFGDGGVASGPNVTHAYGKTGLYTVSVSVLDSNGAVTEVTELVNVSLLSVTGHPSVTSTSVGDSVTFIGSAAGGGGAPYNFSWSFGDGTDGHGASVSHEYAAPGSYEVTVSATDALGSVNGSTVATIVVSAGTGSGSLSGQLFGAPDYVWAAAAVVAIAVVTLFVRHRRAGIRPPPG